MTEPETVPAEPDRDSAPRERGGRRVVGYALAWLVAAVLAVTVGLVAVTSVGASMRGRGPLGNEAIRNAELNDDATVDPADPVERRSITDEYGTFVVECQGTVASGIDTDTVDGWRVVSFETGPDDDVDAVFVNAERSIEVEVFCNAGLPTVAETEFKTLPEATDSRLSAPR